jgi:hypothetical protein
MRFVLLFAAVAGLSGCLINRVGHAPTDRDQSLVHDAINGAVGPSFERNVRGADWVPHRDMSGLRGGLAGGLREDEWFIQFACQQTGAPQSAEVWRLPAAEYLRVLTPIQSDVLTAVTNTGVEVTWASPVELTDGPHPEARFAIRYLRKNREIAGEVTGRLRADASGRAAEARFSDIRIQLREWYCK